MPSGPDDLNPEAPMDWWRRVRHEELCGAHASPTGGPVGPPVGPGVLEGPGFLYRPRQILVETGLMQTAPVENELTKLYHGDLDGPLSGRLHDAGIPIDVFNMPIEVNIPELVLRLRARPHGAPMANVSANTVFTGEVGSYHGGPYGPPISASKMDETHFGEPAAGPPAIAVLDTGYDQQIQTLPHPGLEPRVGYAGQPEIIGNGPYLAQEAGHGTFIDGIIMQQAPTVSISQVMVLSPAGVTDDLTVAQAIAGLANSVPVINLSLGGYAQNAPPPATSAAIAALPDTVVVVAAAGNNSSSEAFYPAAIATTSQNVVSVGALDTTGKNPPRVAHFSNYGSWVDVYAPGMGVYSTYLQGTWMLPNDPPAHSEDGWAIWSGTSFATPQIAAAIANELLPGVTALQAKNAVISQATPIPSGLPGYTEVLAYFPATSVISQP